MLNKRAVKIKVSLTDGCQCSVVSQSEKMQLLLLVCLLAYGSWGVPDKLVVTQTPAVSVTEWGAANISCCWTGTFDRLSVIWLKNETQFDSEIVLSKPDVHCTVLSFRKITRKQSGTYICSVTLVIPFYEKAEGNGTVVTVLAREDPEDSRDADSDRSGEIPESRGKTDDSSAAGRGKRIVLQKNRKGTDDVPYEKTAAGDPREDVLTFIMRSLPILALFLTFIYLYCSWSKAQSHTPAAPENEPTSGQTSDQDQEEEESAAISNVKGKEENTISED
ncbi:uncharacterized protein LOC114851354 isoform X2 [Betta splendens]|uniref:Uncharacterized protein LOC114851354 isoform X2 n=1 Tax=Betta splendens TaxID=158456 RepID=A0A6P7LYC9_BETSP|nr:uncharacterized protein LOC114851354 isoform X2 [Betta splendens]